MLQCNLDLTPVTFLTVMSLNFSSGCIYKLGFTLFSINGQSKSFKAIYHTNSPEAAYNEKCTKTEMNGKSNTIMIVCNYRAKCSRCNLQEIPQGKWPYN